MGLIKRSFLERRPVEVGKIKIGTRGAKRQTSGGNTMYLPERLDHFLVTTMEREDGDGPFKRDEHVHGVVGDQPRELLGYLMYESVEENLRTEMCVYQGRRKQWSCDGELRVLRDGKEQPCQREAGCKCKPYARLHLQLEAQPQMACFYVFRTHGWGSTNNLQTALEEIHREFGTLYRAPVRLFMQKTEDVYSEDGGQERTGYSWKVGISLRLSPTEARAYLQAQAQAALHTRDMLRLEAGAVGADLDAHDREHEVELADEFHPPVGLKASLATHEALQGAADILEAEIVPDGEDEEEAPPEPAPAVDELSRLLVDAENAGVKLTKVQVERCRQGVNSGDEEIRTKTLEWLRGRIAEART